MVTRPNVFEIEQLRSELLRELSVSDSSYHNLVYLTSFFEKILSYNNLNISEAFLSEFLDEYLISVKRFDVCGTEPGKVSGIINQLEYLIRIETAESKKSLYETEQARLYNKLTEIKQRLNGENVTPEQTHKALFPLIDQSLPDGFWGIVDSLTIKINKTEDRDKILLVPSDKQLESLIMEQCTNSWKKALEISKKYLRNAHPFHELVIHFDKKEGIYTGNSLGIALCLAMIEKLLDYYNSRYAISISGNVIFTGGIDAKGLIIAVGENVASQKMKTVFYSDCDTFVIPKSDAIAFESTLLRLNSEYPERNVKLVPVEDITDVLNRRNIIDISKRNLAVRSAKFIRKNWVSAAVTVLLALLLSFLFVMDFDDNPHSFFVDGTSVFIKNKKGKILWSFEQPVVYYLQENQPGALKHFIRLVDINNDGVNEVLVATHSQRVTKNTQTDSRILCINQRQDTLWSFAFKDSAYSYREDLPTEYTVHIIDTATIDNLDVLICWAQNIPSFSNAIFLLDIKTGKRINKTHWVSGQVSGGLLLDVNKDGRDDFVFSGIDNGYEQAVLWAVEIDNLDGYRLTTEEYIIRGKNESQLLFYIRIPKLDYEEFMGFRGSGFELGSLAYMERDSLIKVNTLSFSDKAMSNRLPLMDYRLKSDFRNFDIYVGSSFRVHRDSLVSKGLLNKPYTDTKEYIELQKNKILYWKNGEWLTRTEQKSVN